MERAFDHMTFEEAGREQRKGMGADVVHCENLAINLEQSYPQVT
jgi:hypothetical protein